MNTREYVVKMNKSLTMTLRVQLGTDESRDKPLLAALYATNTGAAGPLLVKVTVYSYTNVFNQT